MSPGPTFDRRGKPWASQMMVRFSMRPLGSSIAYASSKAAVSCFTEALAHNLINEGTNLRACVFYPSGGLLETGLWTAARNRPADLARPGLARSFD